MAKPFIEPVFVAPSSMIAIGPLRYLWNHPPSFVGQNVWLAVLTTVTVALVVGLGLSYLMTACWRLWKSD